MKLSLQLILLFHLGAEAFFVPSVQRSSWLSKTQPCFPSLPSSSNSFLPSTSPSCTRLVYRRHKGSDDPPSKVYSYGTGARGLALFGIVFLACVWFFTIPPSFRRSRICDDQQAAARPEVCISFSTFTNNVAEYYRNGGGIQWDFSIDPGTK